MPRSASEITDVAVRRLAVRDKRYDKRFRGGLEVRVFPSGAKVFQFVYESPVSSSRRRMTLGPYRGKGEGGLTVAEARARADGARFKVSDGIDPQIEAAELLEAKRLAHVEEKRAVSLDDLIDQFALSQSDRRKESTRDEYVKRLRRHVSPVLGGRKARDVATDDIRLLLKGLSESATPTEANKILARLQALFKWALEESKLKHNPTLGISKRGVEKSRQRVLSNKELKILLDALPERDSGEGEGDVEAERNQGGKRKRSPRKMPSLMSPEMGAFFRLLLMTGQRPGDIRKSRWSNIDFESGAWFFPGSETKNGNPQKFYMTPMMRKDLEWLYARRISDRVFPHRLEGRKSEPMCPTSPNQALSRWRLEGKWAFESKWTPHDLRRTCRTNLAEMGVPVWIASRILNHRKSKLDGTYDVHLYVNEISQALADWNERLETILSS